MPVLTRKRKAEYDAELEMQAEASAQLAAQQEAALARQNAYLAQQSAIEQQHNDAEPDTDEPNRIRILSWPFEQPEEVNKLPSPSPYKRQRRDDTYEYKRTDPFRPLPPRGPKTVFRRRAQVEYPSVKKATTDRRRPLPTVWFTVPFETTVKQMCARSRASNDVNVINATNAIFEHVERNGAESVPSEEDVGAWLEANKDLFIEARREQARRENPPVRRVQNEPRGAGLDEAAPAAARHPAARPLARRILTTVANGGIRGAVYCARQAARGLFKAANAIEARVNRAEQEERVAGELAAVEAEQEQGPPEIEMFEPVQHHVRVERVAQHRQRRVRPVAPPLDARFFHPNGQVHTVYKYLTAQIPLPRQWVRWAITNRHHEIPGRGDIREPGTYVADDTFDYDGLFQAIHNGGFQTGRVEIDSFPEHWPVPAGMRDGRLAVLELNCFPPEEEEEWEIKLESASPDGFSTPVRRREFTMPGAIPASPEPEPSPLDPYPPTPTPTPRQPSPAAQTTPVPAGRTFGLPADFYDTSSGSESSDDEEAISNKRFEMHPSDSESATSSPTTTNPSANQQAAAQRWGAQHLRASRVALRQEIQGAGLEQEQ